MKRNHLRTLRFYTEDSYKGVLRIFVRGVEWAGG